MSQTIISVEHLSKSYRLGQIGTGTLTNDLKVWWARTRGKPNPMLKIGQTDHGNMEGETLLALKDVTFTVEPGEVLGIIGRNGAGKSTLLKILSRVTAPSSGCVKVKGRIASLLEVGTGFHPDLTGRENIYLNGAILGMNKDEIRRKFDEIVAFAEIEKFIDTPVKRYSSGMYVRLAFAVAAYLESEILLVDEVLAVGDASFQKKCLGKIGNVASKEGRTVLFVSHNMESIQSLCKRVLLLKYGQVILDGESEKVIHEYITMATNDKSDVGFVDLTSIQLTTSPIRISYARIINSEGITSTSIPCGGSFTIEVGLISLGGRERIFFDFVIKDEYGIRLALISSYFAYSEDVILKDKIKASALVKNVNLAPGRYSIDLMIHRYGGEKIVDLQEAMNIDIVSSDFYGTGKIPSKSLGIIFLPYKWSFE
jgi:lipopolysaccharide transport system ATP-binding protein